MNSHQPRASSVSRMWFVRVYVITTSAAWLVLGGLQMIRPVDAWVWLVVAIAFLPSAWVYTSLGMVRFPYSVLGNAARRKPPAKGELRETKAFGEIISRLSWLRFPARVGLFESGISIRVAGLLGVFLPWESVTEVGLAPAMGGTRILIKSASAEVRQPVRLYVSRKAKSSGFVASLEQLCRAIPGIQVIGEKRV